MTVRRVVAVSSSRADYSHLYWVLKAMEEHTALDPSVILFGAHLSPEFGHTGKTAGEDGFAIAARVESLVSSDSDVGMAKSLGLATLGLADALDRTRPDLLLVIADRYEMLAAGAAALTLRIPIAHVEGGEISRGAIDDAVRNALTKMSHVHLTPHQSATLRVQAMGEESWRIHTVGAPSLDHLCRSEIPEADALRRRLALPASTPLIVVAVHPVTLAADTLGECDALFGALESVDGGVVFCFPNADAGSRRLVQRARAFCRRRAEARIYTNLAATDYFGLLKLADLMVGNSSSGIMESPSFRLPTINIGARQAGRLCADNVLTVPARVEAIVEAMRRGLNPAFRASLADLQNPYGDGRSGERIAQVLAQAPGRERLLDKAPVPVNG